MKRLLFILSLFTLTSMGQNWELVESTQSKSGSHNLYLLLHNDLPVYNHQKKTSWFGRKKLEHNTLLNLFTPTFIIPPEYELINSANGYLQDGNEFIKVQSKTILTTNDESYQLFFNQEGSIIHFNTLHSYSKDTSVLATVFYPDPITSSGAAYGGGLSDNNDGNSSELNDELFDVLVPVTFKNDTFILENEHLKIVNQSSPDILPSKSTSSNFKFNRSETGFEEMMAMYHISRFAEYIKDSLGYSNVMNYQIPVDVYALGGNDNSQFISSTTPPRLNFGEGGIDDAEDPDILIHEYGHGISHSCAPGTLTGTERRGMDEGIGDYWAAVYSKMLNQNNYKEIFNWDGHNEFWNGRSINNNYKYPSDITGSKYADGEVFASTLFQIRDHIPDTAADKIVLESMFGWFSDMTFTDAGELLLEADTALYNGKFTPVIHWVLCERGFTNINCTNSLEKLTKSEIKISYPDLLHGYVKLTGSQLGTQYNITDTQGKVIFRDISTMKPFNISVLSTGVYFLKIHEGETIPFTKK